MRLLIIEDTPEKAEQIAAVVNKVDSKAIVDNADDMRSAVLKLEKHKYDLIIFDFLLPTMKGSGAQNLGTEVLNIVRSSLINKVADCIAITAYDEIANDLRAEFSRKGVFILDFDNDDSEWEHTLEIFLNRACDYQRSRFVIICAVSVERQAFKQINSTAGIPRNENGLDILPIEISNVHGLVILLPRMGIVNAAAISSLVAERYRPELICMSGICAGIKGETEIGQVIIANPCWEYQVGKVTPTGFKIEPYQISFKEKDRLLLKNLIEQECDLEKLYLDIEPNHLKPVMPKIAPLVSGSMVVADEEKVKEIVTQHRKLSGLEMESFGILQGVQLVDPSIIVFSAKSVVDFADERKDKIFQKESAVVSARFCQLAIEKFLDNSSIAFL